MPESVIDRLFATPHLPIRPRPDDVIDALGYDPRSVYVETYWLSVLGPSTLWLLRRLVAGLELQPDGFELPMAETARALGLGDKGGRSSPFVRSLVRLCQFDVAVPTDRTPLACDASCRRSTAGRCCASRCRCRTRTSAGKRSSSAHHRTSTCAAGRGSWRSAWSTSVRTRRAPNVNCCAGDSRRPSRVRPRPGPPSASAPRPPPR